MKLALGLVAQTGRAEEVETSGPLSEGSTAADRQCSTRRPLLHRAERVAGSNFFALSSEGFDVVVVSGYEVDTSYRLQRQQYK